MTDRFRSLRAGDREKSRKTYDEFFATWKDADPNIPILKQAKASTRGCSSARELLDHSFWLGRVVNCRNQAIALKTPQ